MCNFLFLDVWPTLFPLRYDDLHVHFVEYSSEAQKTSRFHKTWSFFVR
jgi:hypothetical protein